MHLIRMLAVATCPVPCIILQYLLYYVSLCSASYGYHYKCVIWLLSVLSLIMPSQAIMSAISKFNF